jgi:hypothetical protein
MLRTRTRGLKSKKIEQEVRYEGGGKEEEGTKPA